MTPSTVVTGVFKPELDPVTWRSVLEVLLRRLRQQPEALPSQEYPYVKLQGDLGCDRLRIVYEPAPPEYPNEGSVLRIEHRFYRTPEQRGLRTFPPLAEKLEKLLTDPHGGGLTRIHRLFDRDDDPLLRPGLLFLLADQEEKSPISIEIRFHPDDQERMERALEKEIARMPEPAPARRLTQGTLF